MKAIPIFSGLCIICMYSLPVEAASIDITPTNIEMGLSPDIMTMIQRRGHGVRERNACMNHLQAEPRRRLGLDARLSDAEAVIERP